VVAFRRRHLGRLFVWQHDPVVRRQLLGQPPTRADLAALLTSSNHENEQHFIIELAANKIAVGYLRLVWVLERQVTVGSFEIIIAAPFRRRGFARSTLQRVEPMVEGWCGTRILKIGVFADNQPARRLYKALGFQEISNHWYEVAGERRQALMMTNRPDILRHRPIGF